MMIEARSVGRLLAAALFACVGVGASVCGTANAATYIIDPRETISNFYVRFLGVFPIHGKFQRTTGTLTFDRANRQGSIEVVIDTTTLVASTARAESSARGADFFEVDKYPVIKFTSSRFVFDESRLASIEGNLTMVGNTHPVVLNVSHSHCEAAAGSEPARCHATADVVVKRSQFGMKAWAHTVGESVRISIDISARLEHKDGAQVAEEVVRQ